MMTVNGENTALVADKNERVCGDNSARANEPPWPGNYPRSRKHSRPVYGAVDLGTNNCRLLVAKPVQGGFRIIDAFSRVVRLGEGLLRSGALSDEAMDRAVDALAVCAGKLGRRQTTRLRAVATEACRAAENSSFFVDRVREETGIALDVITPGEEARLAVMGCWSLLENCPGRAIVFDIGGGSTEVILAEVGSLKEPRIIDWLSIPLGVVTLSDRIDGKEISQEIYQDIRAEVGAALTTFNERNGLNNKEETDICLLGTSGTVTTLTSAHLGLEEYDRNVVDGASVKMADIRGLAGEVTFMTHAERVAIPSIGNERADLVVPGCAIFGALVDSWDRDELTIADRGIREGVLRNLMRRDPLVNAPSPSMPRSSENGAA